MEGMKNDPGAKENPAKYAVDTFAFYLCFQCKAPYFGGKKVCHSPFHALLLPFSCGFNCILCRI
jgi:hypothetical protein